MAIQERYPVYREEIRVSSADLELAAAGRKSCTIRMGIATLGESELALTDGQRRLQIRVGEVDTGRVFSQLSDREARLEGFDSVAALQRDLEQCYGEIDPLQPVTVIYFELLHSHATA